VKSLPPCDWQPFLDFEEATSKGTCFPPPSHMKTAFTASRQTAYLLFASGLLFIRPLQAEVKLPAIFGDHMVLQQEMKVPVWGTADPGEKVTVIVGDHTGTAIADDKGKWRIDLAPFAPSSTTYALVVMGKNMIRFEDVLIGDVWLASGQSNMEWTVHDSHNFKDISDHLDDQQLRVFQADHAYAFEPASDLKGHWAVASRDSLPGFSAIAYFFGHELRGKLNRPIGLVESSFGGTVAQSWTSISGLQKDPPFTNYLNAHDKALADFPALRDGYADKVIAFQKADREWRDKYETDYWKIWGAWQTQAQENRIAGKPVPPEPHFDHPPAQQPADPFGGPNAPGNLFNGMIAPLIPFAIKGVIWHQGEYNAGDAAEYRTLFPRLITDWRAKWGQGDFPFLFVQLAGYGEREVVGGGGWPLLQEAQFMTLSLPNTGMATSIDVGDRDGVHPTDKLDVGLRLALVARHLAYGENLVYTGPMFDKMTVEGSTARISFTQTGSGLIIGAAPWTAADAYPIPTTKLVGFVIAGSDKKFYVADAKIDGNTVVVSSPQVPSPTAVRYDFATITAANLYNKENLPAFPFRTDKWDDVNSPAIPPQMVPPK
jgi:sialate O-acetylesterase